ncbi:acyl-CoA dehydrogenase, mitochondrial precursor [Angomonas deanei]|nr:acyl-CoA dehydrogenase, mitochondrial precursor [Angomonas deanei]|eukprot:EPY30077.1 acyl-CoA dehydrogenase, mitochondrial precursor [Angomonas deanei]
MRRFLSRSTGRFVRQSSYAAGLFFYKVAGEEIFPYPSHKLDADESESLQGLIEQIRSNDKELSLVGSRIATEYGGLGLSHTAHALLCEEVGSTGERSLVSNIQHCGVCSYLISTVGSKEVKGKYLTSMSDGSVMMGWAVQENNGTDLSMTTSKVVSENGGYSLTGRKSCPFASNSTHFLVLAKTLTQTTTEEGPTESYRNSFFIVKRDSPGVKVENDSVTFEKTPVEDIVGVVGEGFGDAQVALFTEQYVYSATLLGYLKRVVQELRDTVPDKWATSVIASCACTMYAMEASLYALTANLDLPTQDSLLEAALVNAFVQQSADGWLSTLATATPTSPQLENCFRGAQEVVRLMEPVHFLHATAACCGVEDYGLVFQKTSLIQTVQQRTMRSAGMRDTIPIKEIDCTAIEKAIVRFGDAVEMTFTRYKSQVFYQSLLVSRLGEAASLIYAASACASRAAMCANKRLPTAKSEKQACHRIHRLRGRTSINSVRRVLQRWSNRRRLLQAYSSSGVRGCFRAISKSRIKYHLAIFSFLNKVNFTLKFLK